MKIEVNFQLKSNILNWSNQKWQSDTIDGQKIDVDIDGIYCKVCVVHNSADKAQELLYAIWELLAWYDGYFYKPISYIVDGEEQEVEQLCTVNMYITDPNWISSASLIGRNKRCFSSEMLDKYLQIRNADRENKSMNRAMINSYFYLLSEAYKDINIEHRLALLMHICDGFAIQFLNGCKKNNSGNINIIVRLLDTEKYKHGAEMLGVLPSKALNALADTRNELTHYIYKENSLGSYISNPDYITDEMINLYAFYFLETALRVALLETIGFKVTDEVKEYLLDVNLDWIRLERHIDEDCVIPRNILRQILQRLQSESQD